MPYGYMLQSATISTASPYQTSGSANTLIDFAFLKPGAGAKPMINDLRGAGRGAQLTSLSGISLIMKLWTTASTGGTAMTPAPTQFSGAVAASATAGAGASGGTGAVSSGSGGGVFRGGIGFSGSGPGAWAAQTPDQVVDQAAGGSSSVDLESLSGTASLNFDWWLGFME